MHILIVSPHPDDAEYGLAGVARKCIYAQHQVTFLVNTGSAHKTDNFFTEERKREAESIKKYGINVVFFDYHIENQVSEFIREKKPEIVFNIDENDEDVTHRLVSNYIDCEIRCASIPTDRCECYAVPVVGYYETFSTRKFVPHIIIDVTAFYADACNMLKSHQSGINMLPSIVYSHRLKHQTNGVRGGVMYGEGIKLSDVSRNYWKVNYSIYLKWLNSIWE